jgi:hypothetical protein
MSDGWNIDAEDWDAVDSMDVMDDELRLLVGNYQEVTIDPRTVLVTHQQGPVGSCRGHSGSTTLEWCYCIATGQVPTAVLSPAFMYYETQRIDGLVGRDVGSTISGGIKLMKETGCCENSFWPYEARYNARRPSDWQEAVSNAAKFKINRGDRLKSYDAIRTFLGSGQGGVDCGISWSSSYSQPVVESYNGGRGGHAIALPSLSDRKDSRGRPYVFMLNSHGERSGRSGWSEWSPNAVDKMTRDSRNVFIGVSDMPNVQPREFTIDDWKSKLRG